MCYLVKWIILGCSLYVQVLECNARNMLLDDALFGFFRKQAVKSLKRNFSDFCRDVSAINKVCLFFRVFCGANFYERC
jgi:hypothetical protein